MVTSTGTRVPSSPDESPLDICTLRVEIFHMRPRSLTIQDARGQGATLRVTRHPEQHKIVLSHWRDDVCVASTPIELSEASALIGVLADALGDAIPTTQPINGASPTSGSALLTRIHDWLRPRLAQIVEFRTPKDQDARKDAG